MDHQYTLKNYLCLLFSYLGEKHGIMNKFLKNMPFLGDIYRSEMYYSVRVIENLFHKA